MFYVYYSHYNCIEDKFRQISLTYSKAKSTNMVKLQKEYTLIWQKGQN